MASMPTAVPPLPPEIAQQQSVAPMMAAMGSAPAAIQDPVSVLEQGMAELEAWAGRYAPLLAQVNPALATYLVPIAQAGKALQSEIGNIRQRMLSPSPQVAGSVPPSVPGNIPGARPAM